MNTFTATLKQLVVPVSIAALFTLFTACGGGSEASPTAGTQAVSKAAVGEKIFFDTSLSEPAGMACATCHDPARAFTDSHALAISMGVSEGVIPGQFGGRNTPTIAYHVLTPVFGFAEEGPYGGLFHDGRAATLADQAGGPPTNPVEMHNPDMASYVDKVKNAAYADDFKRVWGNDVFDNVADAYSKITATVAEFEKTDTRFAPFSSKFDYWLKGRVQLSSDELDGFNLFNARDKGNCAACHPSIAPSSATPPLFTDFTYDALGVPRNTAIPANGDPNYFDLGLCGRADFNSPTLCGKFKVPTLRNVAVTAPYFHNGKFSNLRDVVKFYVTRDINPELWYPPDGSGNIVKFDDMPDQYKTNVNITEPPYDRRPGDLPALTDAEIDHVVAFLNTLTDGYILP
ncbi:MAG: cytochrome-c peroxidase [Sideroxyarcus sp.]|nr:cytochrome-c peroxidase [Sideroxyarcus sp.]